jgi:hypothetical protein
MSTAEPEPPEDELEPSPFDPDEEPVKISRPWQPAIPMTQEDLDAYLRRPIEHRMFNPYQCMFNLMADDGIGYMMGVAPLRCSTMLADPTKSRYCLEHAKMMGVDYYGPGELAELTAAETASNLTRLVPKAVKRLEQTMDDEEAPQGVRAKAAETILDRTGYVKGVDVRVDAKIATVDVTAVISDRLNSLRESMLGVVDETGAGVATVPGEIISGSDEHDSGDLDPDDPGSA